MREELDKGKKEVNNYLKYSGLGFQIAGTVAVGVFIGHELDNWLHTTKPYFTAIVALVFVFLGLYIGLREFIKSR